MEKKWWKIAFWGVLIQGLAQIMYWGAFPVQRFCMYCWGHKFFYSLIAFLGIGLRLSKCVESITMAIVGGEVVLSWMHVAATLGILPCDWGGLGGSGCVVPRPLMVVLGGAVGINALWVSLGLWMMIYWPVKRLD